MRKIVLSVMFLCAAIGGCTAQQSIAGLSSPAVNGGANEATGTQSPRQSIAVETVAALVIARNTGRPLPKAY
ncbi:MAG: hypothetical protein AAFZ01_12690 [Pseudomonadota bacterium]